MRLDDIQNFVLMICNFYEIDDIQGSRLDFNARTWYIKKSIVFESHHSPPKILQKRIHFLQYFLSKSQT